MGTLGVKRASDEKFCPSTLISIFQSVFTGRWKYLNMYHFLYLYLNNTYFHTLDGGRGNRDKGKKGKGRIKTLGL